MDNELLDILNFKFITESDLSFLSTHINVSSVVKEGKTSFKITLIDKQEYTVYLKDEI